MKGLNNQENQFSDIIQRVETNKLKKATLLPFFFTSTICK